MDKPTGTANAIAINDVKSVPESKGNIPKCLSVNNGVHSGSVRKSIIETSLKKFTASIESTKTIPTVTAIVMRALNKSPLSITNSLIFRIYKIKIRVKG